jgi:hypothetical protein
MFPTNADIEFWTERRAPGWARALREAGEARQRRLSWYRPDASIHACVNAHAGLKHVSHEATASALCSFIRGWRKRGEDVRAELARIADSPGTLINPQQRARFARQWVKRIDAIRRERGQDRPKHPSVRDLCDPAWHP